MLVRSSVKRMTQIFPRKSEPAFPVSGFQQTRSRISESPPVTRSIASLGCLQPVAVAPIESIGSLSRSAEKEQGDDAVELDVAPELLLHEEVIVLRSLSGENLDVFIHELFLSKKEEGTRVEIR